MILCRQASGGEWMADSGFSGPGDLKKNFIDRCRATSPVPRTAVEIGLFALRADQPLVASL